jgi:nitrite reductase/ring-hydroxylating ferredoxin subunit
MTTTPDATPDPAAADRPGLLGSPLDRRTVLRGAAVAGGVVAAGIGLAACGSGSGGTGKAGTVLGNTGDVPVGQGKVFADQHVVVTQPTEGTFKGFSSTCTHMGCTVATVSGGLIHCPCHGSAFSVTDGSVKAGPAPKPLPSQNITVQNNQISLA